MTDPASPSTSADGLRFEEEIAHLAHQYYEEEGRPEGRDKEHWQRAEEAIRAQSSVGPGPEAFAPPQDS